MGSLFDFFCKCHFKLKLTSTLKVLTKKKKALNLIIALFTLIHKDILTSISLTTRCWERINLWIINNISEADVGVSFELELIKALTRIMVIYLPVSNIFQKLNYLILKSKLKFHKLCCCEKQKDFFVTYYRFSMVSNSLLFCVQPMTTYWLRNGPIRLQVSVWISEPVSGWLIVSRASCLVRQGFRVSVLEFGLWGLYRK